MWILLFLSTLATIVTFKVISRYLFSSQATISRYDYYYNVRRAADYVLQVLLNQGKTIYLILRLSQNELARY